MATTIRALLRLPLACLLCVALLAHTHALAAEAPQVDASTALVTLRVQGTAYANVRAAPDPRSQVLMQVPAGSTNIRATGATHLHGDTWWIEIQSGSVTGWLNARLIGRAPEAVPLQPFVNIDALPLLSDYAFKDKNGREASATSFDECARRCVDDALCAAIEYQSASAVCRVMGQAADLSYQPGTVVSAKPLKVPPGGWSAQSAVRFDRSADQSVQSASYRESFAHRMEECAFVCASDLRCAAFAYNSKKRLCSGFETASPRETSIGIDLAVRRPTPVAENSQPTSVFDITGAKENQVNLRALDDAFQHVFADAGRTATKAVVGLQRQGRIIVKLVEPPLGEAMHVAATPREIEGTLQNLAAVIGRTDQRIVHLTFFTLPSTPSPPTILASTSYATPEAAHAAALKLQVDLDNLARAAGLGIDPLSLLKPHRR